MTMVVFLSDCRHTFWLHQGYGDSRAAGAASGVAGGGRQLLFALGFGEMERCT
jgi:hypothetical protein